MFLLANRGKPAGGGKARSASHRPELPADQQSLISGEFFVVDSQFSGGTYATDKHSGYSLLSENARDILKVLGDEYICYLCDPQGMQRKETAGSPEKIIPPESSGPDPAADQKTLTEYLLGDDRLIDRVLDETSQDEWISRTLFGEDEQDLFSALAPEYLVRDLPDVK